MEAAKMPLCWFVVTSMLYLSIAYTVTVEEGKAAILTCPGFVPNPENINEKLTLFNWFKASQSNISNQNKVAFHDKTDGVQNSLGNLSGRATIDGTTGALEIPQTRVSDDHVYTCIFQSTASGNIQNETQLVITVTPSESDLKVTASPPGLVHIRRSVTFECSASRVKPPPKEMFWKFTDDENLHAGLYKNETNSDKLTSSVSVEYTMTVNVIDNGRKLKCYYVTAAGNTISSQEATVKVLYKPSGQPQISVNKKEFKVNSLITLTCDAASVNGSITWYKWQFANGTELGNTTEKTWTYKVNDGEEILLFECQAGNAMGQSATSSPIAIVVKDMSQVKFVTAVTSVTVEEGRAAILTCPGFVTNPEQERYTIFNWFKASQSNKSASTKVAFYDKAGGVQNSLGDLSGRATIDGKTGALEIPQTTVSDDHVYTCYFASTASGVFRNETQLVITVTPSESDLKVTASSPGLVHNGRSVTFKCSASRVKPPKEMFWKFTDDENLHAGQYKNETNSDKLTSSVSMEYTMTVHPSDNGRKLKCYYVTAAGNTIISSQEATVKVLYKPSGQPQVSGSKKVVKVNSSITLTCDAASVNGSITWYQWLFANGNELGNTTEKTWTYTANSAEETLQFVCIAGNAAGQSTTSSPIDVIVKDMTQRPSKVPLIIGVAIGCVVTLIIIFTGICIFIFQQKWSGPATSHDINEGNDNHSYENAEVIPNEDNQTYESIDPAEELPYEPLRKSKKHVMATGEMTSQN